MKKKLRRLSLTVCLLLLAICTCGFCLVSCSIFESVEITFKQPPYVYERGGVADAYDFIERENGVKYTFAYDYLMKTDRGETVTSERELVQGNTIYLNEISRYTLYVTATKGSKSVSDSTTFDVIGETPVLLTSSAAIIYKVGDSARVSVLLDKASPVALPSSSDLVVDYYTYQESQAPTIEESENKNPKIKIELDTANPDQKIYFEELGIYEFHVIATNGERWSDARFKVKVLSAQTAEIEGISAYKNAEFGENEDGSVEPSIIRLTGTPDYTKASYVVLDDEYVSGQVAKFEFYGKNMPAYIGFFNQDDLTVSDSNSLTSGKGFVFAVERGEATGNILYGCNRMGTGAVQLKKSGLTAPIEHFGFNSLEDGKHYIFEVCMKATGVVYYNEAGYGAPWVKGKYTQRIGMFYSLYEVNEDGSYAILYHSSAERYETSCGGSFFEEGQDIKGKLVAYSSTTKDVTFKYYEDTLLNKDFDETAFSYDEETNVMTWDEVEGATSYVIATGDETSNRVAVLDKYTNSYNFTGLYDKLDNFKSLDIKVYASIGNNTFSGKKYEYLLTKGPTNLTDIYVSDGDVDGYDSQTGKLNVVLEGSKVQKTTDLQKQVGYLAFDTEYTLDNQGTYIDIYFTGNNMPQVEFFASDIWGNVMNASGDSTSKGFVVTNGHAHPSAYMENPTGKVGGYSAYTLFYRYGISSYNRLTDATFPGGALITDSIVDGQVDYIEKKTENGITQEIPRSVTYSNFSMYSLMKLQPVSQNYRYTVGMYQEIDGSVWLSAVLVKIDNGVETPFAEWKTPVVITPAVQAEKNENGAVITPAVPAKTVLDYGEKITGKIVLHAAFKGEQAQSGDNFYTRFTCSKPYEGNRTITPIMNNATVNESTGEISLKGGNFNSNSAYEKNTGYIAFGANTPDGKFTLDKEGVYVEMRFVGNNMPNVEFFGSSVSGNMFNDGVNTGYVVSNGNAPATMYRNYKRITQHGLINGDLAEAYENATIDYQPNSYKYNGIVNFDAFFTYGVSDYNKFKQGVYADYERENELKIAYYQKDSLAWSTDYNVGYSDFSMYALMQDETIEWRYIVGMYLDENSKVWVDAKLYKITSEDSDGELFAEQTLVADTLEEGEIRSGYIVLHAAMKGTQTYATEENGGDFYTKFTYTEPYKGNTNV